MKPSILLGGCLLLSITGLSYGIKAFGMYLNDVAWGPSGMTWVIRNLTMPAGTMDVTICMYIKYHHFPTNKNLIVAIGPMAQGVARFQSYASGNVDRVVQGVNHKYKMLQWSHVCFVLGMNLRIICDGTVIDLINIGSNTNHPPGTGGDNFLLALGLPYGMADPQQAGTPAGFYTIPTVLFRDVTTAEAVAMANCQSTPADDAGPGAWIAMWLSATGLKMAPIIGGSDIHVPTAVTTQVTTGLAAALPPHLPLYDFATSEVCPPHPLNRIMVFAQVNSYSKSVARCTSVGGTMINLDDTTIINNIISENMIASIQTPFFYGESQVGDMCKFLLIDKPALVVCDDPLPYTACKIPAGFLLTLRGPELKKYVQADMEFYMVVENQKPVFYSLNRWKIIENDIGLLEMYDPNGIQVFRTIEPANWAPGRKVWQPSTGVGNDLVLLLSNCNETEFTCNNGLCISLDLRCDGKDDCNDDSDETCVYLLPLPGSYKKDRPPDTTTTLNVTVTLKSVTEVNVDDNTISLWIKMNSRWIDDRVSLWLLNEDMQDNSVDGSLIWHPTFRMENSIFDDSLDYNKGSISRMAVVAGRNGPPNPILHGGYEGYKYDGILEKQEEFVLTYVCDFDLNMFPFGVWECRINISIVNYGRYVPVFEEMGFEQKSMPLSLSLFETSELRYQFLPGYRGSNMLSLRIKVDGKYASYILTMFMPCFLIGVIGYLTLFYDTYNFSDRIMVTLSCLIVVAALLSQVSSTMPMSASSKAIDRFFLYFIIRLFVVYMHHAGLFFITEWMKKKKEKMGITDDFKEPPVSVEFIQNTINHKYNSKSMNYGSVPSIPGYVPVDESKPKVHLDIPDVDKPVRKIRPYAVYYNYIGLIIGGVVDFLFAILFIVEILKETNKVNDQFYND